MKAWKWSCAIRGRGLLCTRNNPRRQSPTERLLQRANEHGPTLYRALLLHLVYACRVGRALVEAYEEDSPHCSMIVAPQRSLRERMMNKLRELVFPTAADQQPQRGVLEHTTDALSRQRLLPPGLHQLLHHQHAGVYYCYFSILILSEAVLLWLYGRLEGARQATSTYGEDVLDTLDGCQDLSQARRRLYRWYRCHEPPLGVHRGLAAHTLWASRRPGAQNTAWGVVDNGLPPERRLPSRAAEAAASRLAQHHAPEGWQRRRRRPIEEPLEPVPVQAAVEAPPPPFDQNMLVWMVHGTTVSIPIPNRLLLMNELVRPETAYSMIQKPPRDHSVPPTLVHWFQHHHPRYAEERLAEEHTLRVILDLVDPWVDDIVSVWIEKEDDIKQTRTWVENWKNRLTHATTAAAASLGLTGTLQSLFYGGVALAAANPVTAAVAGGAVITAAMLAHRRMRRLLDPNRALEEMGSNQRVKHLLERFNIATHPNEPLTPEEMEGVHGDLAQVRKELDHMSNMKDMADGFARQLKAHLSRSDVASHVFEYVALRSMMTIDHVSWLDADLLEQNTPPPSTLTQNVEREKEVTHRMYAFLNDDSAEDRRGEIARVCRVLLGACRIGIFGCLTAWRTDSSVPFCVDSINTRPGSAP